MRKYCLVCFCLMLLSSCGGGSNSESISSKEVNNENGNNAGMNQQNNDEENETDAVLTGVFIDSPVEGLQYSTESQSGTTNSLGEFKYVEGESIVFSIGDLDFPAVNSNAVITPVDLAVNSDDSNATAVNIARLLQSLDADNNPENGIKVLAEAVASSSQLNFNLSVSEFEISSEVINFIANSGSTNSELIDEDVAINHVNESASVELVSSNSADVKAIVDESSFTEVTTLNIEPFNARYWRRTAAHDIKDVSIRFDVAENTGAIRWHGGNYISTTDAACLVPYIDVSKATYLGFTEVWKGDRIWVEHDLGGADAHVRELVLKNVTTGQRIFFYEGSDLCLEPSEMDGVYELQNIVVSLHHLERGSLGQVSAWFVEGLTRLPLVDWTLHQ